MARSARGVSAESALDAVLRLKPKSYEYLDGVSQDGVPLPAGVQFGFLAQDVARVLPALVGDVDIDRKGRRADTQYIGVNYIGMIPVLVAAIQEQQALIASLTRRLANGATKPRAPRARAKPRASSGRSA